MQWPGRQRNTLAPGWRGWLGGLCGLLCLFFVPLLCLFSVPLLCPASCWLWSFNPISTHATMLWVLLAGTPTLTSWGGQW